MVAAEASIQSGELAGGEAQAAEVAEKIRLLAATDPTLAADLVQQLVTALDRATGGAFTDQLTGVARSAVGVEDGEDEPVSASSAAPSGADVPFGGGYGSPPVTIAELEAAARSAAERA